MGGSAVCFNSTFLTLLVGENKAFWGPTSPSATRPEGLSRGPVQERDWHGSCTKRLRRTFQQTSKHYIRCVLLRGRSRRLFQVLPAVFQRSLSAVTWFTRRLSRFLLCKPQLGWAFSIFETMRYKYSLVVMAKLAHSKGCVYWWPVRGVFRTLTPVTDGVDSSTPVTPFGINKDWQWFDCWV